MLSRIGLAGAAGGSGKRGINGSIEPPKVIQAAAVGVGERHGLRKIDADGVRRGADDALQKRLDDISALVTSL
jgi:hypothetical protein